MTVPSGSRSYRGNRWRGPWMKPRAGFMRPPSASSWRARVMPDATGETLAGGAMTPPLFMANRIIQMAWVVQDLERAMKAWINTNGVGPFFVAPLQNLVDRLDYRGQAVNLAATDVRLALAQAGDI